MKYVTLIGCLLFFPVVFLAQTDSHYIDSLESYLKKKDDSLKLRAISDLAWEYNYTDVDKAIRLSLKGVSIAQKLKRTYAIGQAYSDLGTSYYFKRDFDSSAYYYLKALPITKSVNDPLELAYLYNQLGALYKERSEFQTSLKFSFSSLKIYQKLKERHKTALLFNNIGVTYEELKNFKLAESYYQKALLLNESEKDEGGIARNYVGLGNVNITLKKLDKAYNYYEKASLIFEKLGWGIEYSVALNNMGDVLDEKKMFAESVSHRMKALEVAREIEDIQGQSKYHLYIADALMKMKQFSQAKVHIMEAEQLSKTIQSYEIEMDLYEMNSKYYFGINQFERGVTYLNKFHDLKDSLYSSELSSNVASMEVRHNTQQLRIKNAESEARNLKLSNDKLRANQQRNYILLGALFILLIGGTGFYLSNQKLKRIEERKRINAMLQSEESERTRIARELHDGLGQLLSTARINAAAIDGVADEEDEVILKNTIELIDQSIGEVRVISHNLMPQALSDKGIVEALQELVIRTNTAKSTQVSFRCSDFTSVIPKFVQVSIYRVVQEILTNMLKHADAAQITIELSGKQSHFNLIVKDNGKGFDIESIAKSDGIGWKNIQTRLSLIHAKLTVESVIGKGTSVIIQGEL